MSDRQRRFILFGGILLLVSLCTTGGSLAIYVAQRYLGTGVNTGETLDSATGAGRLLSQRGLLITNVEADSPAARAGLRRGQIVLSVEENDVDTSIALQRILQTYEAGEQVSLTLLNGNRTENIIITLGEPSGYLGLGLLAPSPASSSVVPPAGLVITPEPGFPNRVIPQLRAVVLSVIPDSPAQMAGFQAGDIITNVDEEAILTSDELVSYISSKSAGDTVLITYRRGEDTRVEAVRLTRRLDGSDRGFLGVQLQSDQIRSNEPLE